MQTKDQLGREVDFPEDPKRIVSLVPSQTELLVDLGLTDKLVGVTKFCVHPEDIRKEKTVVGGTKQVHYDKIAALQPDIIIANKEENTEEMVTELEKIAPVWVSDIYTVEDSLDFIEAMGELFHKKTASRDLIEAITNSRSDFLSTIQDRKPLQVAYLIWKKPYMVCGRWTFINALLEENRFENIIKDPRSRYPEVDQEELKTADLILLSSEPYPFKEADRQQLEIQLNKSVMLVDGEYFSWYGSRLAKAYDYFKRLL